MTRMHDIANASDEVSKDSSLDVRRRRIVTHRNGSIDDEQPSPTCNAVAAVQVVKYSCSDLNIRRQLYLESLTLLHRRDHRHRAKHASKHSLCEQGRTHCNSISHACCYNRRDHCFGSYPIHRTYSQEPHPHRTKQSSS
jgi:hypothetical protein